MMTFRDRIAVSTGNLRRRKLRALLTVSGVVIAIAAFVSMLSFGAGNQAYLEEQFNKLGLFTTLQVYPKSPQSPSDTAHYPALNDSALTLICSIPGVNLAYPYDAFSAKVQLGDSLLNAKVQALPVSALRTKIFSTRLTGAPFRDDSSRQVIVSDDLLKKAGFPVPDSAIGRPLIMTVRVSTIDSALSHLIVDRGVSLLDRYRHMKLDSLFHGGPRRRLLTSEFKELLRRFTNGYFNAQAALTDTLTICGVRTTGRMGPLKIENCLIPVTRAAAIRSTGFGGSPIELYSSLTSGSLFSETGRSGAAGYPQITVDFDPHVPYKTLRDSIEARGFRVVSFAAEFENIQKMFLYFNLGLALIGLVALSTASLGIVNTMIMSITERRKEIGILKSLGADESDIRGLFLVESGIIGFAGTIGGILLGWGISRVASTVAQAYMRSHDVPAVDLFALPVWLIGIALVIGVSVSVAAGLYPAGRAAHVDPVEALRTE